MPEFPALPASSLAIELKLGSRIRLEPVFVWHRHLGERLCVHGFVWLDNLGLREDVGHDAVDVVIAQRSRCVERHGAFDIVEQRCGVGPVAFDRLYWSFARKRAAPAKQLVAADALRRIALELVAVTGGTGARIDLGALSCVAAARWQATPIRWNREESGESLRRGRRAKAKACNLRRGGLRECERTDKRGRIDDPMRGHW